MVDVDQSSTSSIAQISLAVSVHLIHWRAAFVRSVPVPVRSIIIHWPGASLGLVLMRPIHSSKLNCCRRAQNTVLPHGPLGPQRGCYRGQGCRLTYRKRSSADSDGQTRATGDWNGSTAFTVTRTRTLDQCPQQSCSQYPTRPVSATNLYYTTARQYLLPWA